MRLKWNAWTEEEHEINMDLETYYEYITIISKKTFDKQKLLACALNI